MQACNQGAVFTRRQVTPRSYIVLQIDAREVNPCGSRNVNNGAGKTAVMHCNHAPIIAISCSTITHFPLEHHSSASQSHLPRNSHPADHTRITVSPGRLQRGDATMNIAAKKLAADLWSPRQMRSLHLLGWSLLLCCTTLAAAKGIAADQGSDHKREYQSARREEPRFEHFWRSHRRSFSRT